ncbi:MAG: ion transporter [Prolixibacteraceae bacterium]
MIKTKIYQLIEKGSHGRRLNRIFDYFIMTLILLSVIVIILESIPEINTVHNKILRVFNIFSIIVFTIEYSLRLYVSDLTHPADSRIKSALRFIFSLHGLIDLLAIIPFYLPMLIKMDLRFLRILRLVRFLRILKVNRYNNSLNIIGAVIREKKSELAVTGFVTFLILLLASFLMYYVEGEKQPEQFPNILASFWWAIATLTTVGYGDVYPITALGKVISGFIALLGIGLVALPTGLISAGFMSKIEKRNQNDIEKTCPHCGKPIHE